MARRVLLLAVGLLSACSLVTSLDDLGDGGDQTGADASTDGSNPGDAATDAPTDGAADACGADTSTDPKNCGTCGHDCCGGACEKGQCQPLVLATQQANPAWLLADATHVYWEPGGYTGQFPPASHDIMRVKTDGTGLEAFAQGRPIFNALNNFSGIQSDGTRIIWLEFNFQTLFRVAWADKSSAVGDAGVAVQTSPALDPNASSGLMKSFLVDSTHAYWFGSTPTECPGSISCLYVASTNALGTYSVVHSSFYPYAISSAGQDDAYIYPWTANNQLYRMGKVTPDGGLTADLLVQANSVAVNAVDQTSLYWSDQTAGTIYKASKLPGSDAGTTVFATLQNQPETLTVADGDVYWANADGIVTCPAAGCPNGPDKPRVVVAETGIASFAVTSSCFFYGNSASGTIKVVGR